VKRSRSESFVLCRSKISGNFCFNNMNLGMFDRFYPSLDERRFDMSISHKNSEKYVIPMYRKNVWTNQCMQEPRKKCL
jgi:hypothetical protein